jgi:hypothetical protein
MKLRFLALAGLLAAFTVPAAMADTDYTFNITSEGGLPASGTLTLDEVSPTVVKFDGFTLTSFDMTESLSALIASGGTFELSGGGLQVALYLRSGVEHDDYQYNGPVPGVEVEGTFAAPVNSMPEGSSLAMMGMTGIGLLGALKRKFFTR